MENLTALVKVSASCPLGCPYCYEGDKSELRMQLPVLEGMVRALETRDGAIKTTYVWHGAEPLTMGEEFYRAAVALQKPYSHSIRNSMQSSGVLLTPSFADTLVEGKIGIGFSLDGPEHIHNLTRPYREGKGSFQDVMRAVRLMRERGQNPGVIAVLTRHSLDHIDEIYDFFKEEKLSFKINPLMRTGHASSHDELHISTDERVDAATRLFDRWFDDQDARVEYTTAANTIRAFFTKETYSCDAMESCQEGFIAVDTAGNVLPCSRFSTLIYGNLLTTPLDTVLTHPTRQRLLARYQENKPCQVCQYNFLCHAGCMHNAQIAGDIMQRDPNCLGNQRIFAHIAARVNAQLHEDGILGGNA